MIVPLVVDSSQKNTVLYLYVWSLKCGKRSQSSRGPNTFARHCRYFYTSSIFTRSFAVILGLLCTFRTKVRSSLRDRTRLLPERYDGCVVPWCLYLCTIVCTDECGTFRRLEIAPKDEPDLWRSTNLFLRSWPISFDFLMMSSKEALSLKVGLEIHHRYTSNWLKLCQKDVNTNNVKS